MDNIQDAIRAPGKLYLLFCIVNSGKADFYCDFLSSQKLNVQLTSVGRGTASESYGAQLTSFEKNKAVLIAPLPEERKKEVLTALEEKFRSVRNGKGVAFTVPMSATVGVLSYRFLADLR